MFFLMSKRYLRSLNEYKERIVIRSITSGRVDTAVEARKDFNKRQNVHVSAQTVRNMLKRRGLKSAVKKKSLSQVAT